MHGVCAQRGLRRLWGRAVSVLAWAPGLCAGRGLPSWEGVRCLCLLGAPVLGACVVPLVPGVRARSLLVPFLCGVWGVRGVVQCSYKKTCDQLVRIVVPFQKRCDAAMNV